ncbi:hypothetical protein R3W88_012787 [Solanum pinnatisectum]|uniref:Endonuclease/exonuclease/phosphatase domain-containing protein n=1 Tax=Solanum pinnatisectum TaxID=50273 RepID=A0AAV9LCU9_9SOLN|nr:hypothetical protein R3W88_012787 [Solanum pinnatisectum]
MENISSSINDPWCVGGDFNDIMDPDEKLGGKPHRANRCFDFISTMEACGLSDLGFVGPKFTWCNNRRPSKRIWKRLDRVFVNDLWAQSYHTNTIKHLARTGSDHRPLLMQTLSNQNDSIRYFRFLNLWTQQSDFLETVQNSWNMNVTGNAMWKFQCKLKVLSKNLSKWSRETIGDIHEQVNKWETKVQLLEELDTLNNNEQSREDLNREHAEYVKWPGMQDALLKKKTRIGSKMGTTTVNIFTMC